MKSADQLIRINLGIPEAMFKRLESFRKRKGLDRNNAIRQFIADGLDEDDRRRKEGRQT